MKKYLSFMIGWVHLFGGPAGNPAAPCTLTKGFFIPSKCWLNVRAGYEGDFVFDANMKQIEEGSGDVDHYSQTTNSGTVTLNLLNRLDLYGVFGSSRISADWRFSDIADRIRYAKMETLHNFLWAIGGRAVLAKWGNWVLGLQARYSASHNHLLWFTVDGIGTSTKGSRFHARSWQTNLGVAYHIHWFTPYVSVDYLSALGTLDLATAPIADQGARSDHFSNQTPVGLILGCTLSTGEYFMCNVEGRVINEEAVTISGEFRF